MPGAPSGLPGPAQPVASRRPGLNRSAITPPAARPAAGSPARTAAARPLSHSRSSLYVQDQSCRCHRVAERG
jgi:hypothetical protein